MAENVAAILGQTRTVQDFNKPSEPLVVTENAGVQRGEGLIHAFERRKQEAEARNLKLEDEKIGIRAAKTQKLTESFNDLIFFKDNKALFNAKLKEHQSLSESLDVPFNKESTLAIINDPESRKNLQDALAAIRSSDPKVQSDALEKIVQFAGGVKQAYALIQEESKITANREDKELRRQFQREKFEQGKKDKINKRIDQVVDKQEQRLIKLGEEDKYVKLMDNALTSLEKPGGPETPDEALIIGALDFAKSLKGSVLREGERDFLPGTRSFLQEIKSKYSKFTNGKTLVPGQVKNIRNLLMRVREGFLEEQLNQRAVAVRRMRKVNASDETIKSLFPSEKLYKQVTEFQKTGKVPPRAGARKRNKDPKKIPDEHMRRFEAFKAKGRTPEQVYKILKGKHYTPAQIKKIYKEIDNKGKK